jgi:uncharacterized protein (TIGR03437 family)
MKPYLGTRWIPVAGLLVSSFLLSTNLALGQDPPVVGAVTELSYQEITKSAPGSEVYLFGSNLVAPDTQCESTIPLAIDDSPCGLTVTIGGKHGAIVFANASQATIFLPWDLPLGPTELVATVAGAGSSDPVPLSIQKYAPALLLDQATGNGFLTDADFVNYTPDRRAKAGDHVLAFAVGLGNTENNPPFGDVTPAETIAALGTPRVFLKKTPLVKQRGVAQEAGEVEAEVLYAVLLPEAANTFQVYFTVPDGVSGNQDVVLQMSDKDGTNAVRSTAATLPVETVLSLNSVVNGASFEQGPIAPGSIISAFADAIPTSDNLGVFPASEHEGLSVTFDGEAAPLFHVIASQNQINLLAPNDLAGTGTVNVILKTSGGDTTAFEVQLTEAAPGIFPIHDPGSDRIYAVATLANTVWLPIPDAVSTALGAPINCEADGINVASTCGQPAKPGDGIQIYATGLGRATPDGDPTGEVLPSDQVAPADGSVLYSTVMKPEVTIGGLPAELIFSGLAPGFAGLDQVNVVVPAGVEAGDEVELKITMPNGASTSALIAIQ